MSGARVYTEYGTFSYPDAETYYNDQEGLLDVKDSQGDYLATFNARQWSLIEFVESE